jgi:hypothetical protein
MTLHNTPRSKIHDSLVAAIQRKVPPASVLSVPVDSLSEKPEKAEPRPKALKSKRRIGSPVQFWLHEEDRRILRELAAWLSGQGVRLTDSLVIRAALRSARTGDDFLKAFREAAELDGRLKRHKSSSV